MTTPPSEPGRSLAAALPALVAHDVKNALGVLEAQLSRLVEAVDAPEAREAHAQCVALRQRLVMMLTLYPASAWQPVVAAADAPGLPVLRTDESPVDFLLSVERRTPRPRREVELTVGACLSAPSCWTFDPHLVRLALDAALHNAWRYARRHVHLDARGEPGYLVFVVDDDGPGPDGGRVASDDPTGTPDPIDPIDPARGGDPAAPPPTERSTGLGLALCEAVARAHGALEHPGRITLTPGPAGGARFELWLA